VTGTSSVNLAATLPGSNTPLVRSDTGAPDPTWFRWFQAIQLRTGNNPGVSSDQLQADDESQQVLEVTFQRTPPKGRPALPFAITVSASPFTYPAPVSGTVLVHGGTLTGIGFSRDRTTFFAYPSAAAAVAVFQGDVVKVTYSAAPTMTMIPGAGGA
jgi:hypothetical protein